LTGNTNPNTNTACNTSKKEKPKIQNPLSSDFFSDEDKELFTKLTLLFSKIKNKPLKIYFHENSKKHYITLNKYEDVYEIHTDPLDKMLDTKTAFEHEASHYLFNSALKTLRKILFEILGSNYTPSLRDKHLKAIKSVFNILEDIRIESCYSQINLGSKSRFNKVKNLYGLRDLAPRKEIKDPITALFCVRFNQKNKLKKSGKYPEALTIGKQAENLDEIGIIHLVKKYYDLYVREYIESKKQNLDLDDLMKNQNQIQEQKEEEEKEDEDNNEDEDNDSDPNPNADPQEPTEDEDEDEDEDSDTNPDTNTACNNEDEDEDEDEDNDSDPNPNADQQEPTEDEDEDSDSDSDYEDEDEDEEFRH
jgi:hypothetical protein